MIAVCPRLKPIHSPIRSHKGYVSIGSGTDYAVQIKDPDGSIEHLLRLLDGQHSMQEIIECMLREFPHFSQRDVEQGIRQFDEAGYLETVTSNTSLSTTQIERYRNNINFFSIKASINESSIKWQELLQDKHVCILGLGGTGSALAMQAVGLGIGQLTLVDFDVVELRNLNRQILYTTRDIGLAKVEVAKQRLNEINPDTIISGINLAIRHRERHSQRYQWFTPCFRLCRFPTQYHFSNQRSMRKGKHPLCNRRVSRQRCCLLFGSSIQFRML